MQLERTPMYLKDLRLRTKEIDGETKRIVVLTMMIEPFTRATCEALVPGVKSKLFAADGNPTEDLLQVTAAAHAPLLIVRLYSSTDHPVPALTLPDVELERKVAIRRDKETPSYSARLKLIFSYPAADHLLLLAHNVNSQFIVSLEDQQPGLEQPPATDKQKRQRAQPRLVDATTATTSDPETREAAVAAGND